MRMNVILGETQGPGRLSFRKIRPRNRLSNISAPRRSIRPVVGASIVLVLLLPLADMIPLVSFPTDEKFEDIERQHRAFVERAESILLSGQDYEQAESYLEKARALLIKSPTGDFSPRSMKCDYYYAWLLCRKHNSRGYKLFDKILKNDGLSPEQKW